MGSNRKNTDINWISIPRRGEEEWSRFSREVILEKPVKQAVIRFESDCICAVFVNGEFIISGTGRYPERVNCHEVTSRLKKGNNLLEIVLGGHYFQGFGYETKEKRGYWLNQAALELEVSFTDGSILRIPTNKSWIWEPTEEGTILETMQVTKSEYDTMWKNALLWQETEIYPGSLKKEVLDIVGEEYKVYAEAKPAEVISCQCVVSTNMRYDGNSFTAICPTEESYIVLDMGRLVVGYIEFGYNTAQEVKLLSYFDVREQPQDLEQDAEVVKRVERLSTRDSLPAEKIFYRNLRRRAFRYVKLIFSGEIKEFEVHSIGVRLCMFPETKKGWFWCSDTILNRAWETGKYTLHVNKQQEYESCPRCEMLFFAGDGALDALVDLYVFGDCGMLNTSLSLKHEESASGISGSQKFKRTVWQWDYFAWRIICIYQYFCQTGDKDFLRRHYEEATTNILWLTERMNDRDLLFQIPAFHSTFSSTMIQVDWACSIHRIGENAFLNCLLYKSLVCMTELAVVIEDFERGNQWKTLAERVKIAINNRLWNEEKHAYVDGMGDYICQDANALAVLFGVADEKRSLLALEAMKENLWSDYGSAMADVDFGNRMLRGGKMTISPMMSARECEAWFLAGKPEEGLELIRRVWGAMLKKGATTFWEFNPNNADEGWEHTCHAWSAGCTYLLSAFVLGIRPLAPNWEHIIFAPRPCDLEEGRGVVPTPYGLVAASWQKKADGVVQYKIVLPEAIELLTDISKEERIEVIKY